MSTYTRYRRTTTVDVGDDIRLDILIKGREDGYYEWAAHAFFTGRNAQFHRIGGHVAGAFSKRVAKDRGGIEEAARSLAAAEFRTAIAVAADREAGATYITVTGLPGYATERLDLPEGVTVVDYNGSRGRENAVSLWRVQSGVDVDEVVDVLSVPARGYKRGADAYTVKRIQRTTDLTTDPDMEPGQIDDIQAALCLAARLMSAKALRGSVLAGVGPAAPAVDQAPVDEVRALIGADLAAEVLNQHGAVRGDVLDTDMLLRLLRAAKGA